MSKRSTVAIFLLAAGTAWNGGNIGPAVEQLTSEFSVSLSSVGLLSGTVLFGALVAASLATPKLSDAVGAGIMLGVAAALGIGGALAEAGIDWRVAFAVSAVVGFSSLPLLPSRVEVAPAGGHRPGDLRRILRSLPEWRLLLLFVAILAVPLVISAWFNHYLITDGGIGAGVAGLLAFALFGLCTMVRIVGGREAGRGGSPVALAGVAPIVAAGGIALFAVVPEIGGVVTSIVLMGVGFALPYATMFDEGERLLADDPVLSLTFLTVGANATPIWAIPVIGSALSTGHGETAFLVVAGFVALAGVANLRPAARSRSGEGATEPT